MRAKLILPSLTEATSPFFRPIKYSLFPPLGLATLAGYLDPEDRVEIQDEHVERLNLDDDPVLRPGLVERAAASGLRSLFVGFETLNSDNLRAQRKYQNLNRDYEAAVRRLHDQGVMVNASFVFGMDEDDETVFDRTVDWAIGQGIETATFHILTPYPGTALHARLAAQGRLLHNRWDLYDTRHTVFQPARLSPQALEAGYRQAYRNFYRWGNIWHGALTKATWNGRLRHLAYAGGWKKLEPCWDRVIRARKVGRFLPVLESVLSGFGRHASDDSPSESEASAFGCTMATNAFPPLPALREGAKG